MLSSGATIPARAPPSIVMLHIVMRPSIERPRTASPVYSTTWPLPPAIPILPMMARMMSFAVTPFGRLPRHVDLHRLRLELRKALRGEHVLHFAGADAEGERAERAVRGRVAVAADDRESRLRDAEFRADDVHDALVAAVHIEQIDAELFAVARERLELAGGVWIEHRQSAILGGNGVVHHREGQLRPAHGASGSLDARERLRRSAFVDQMPVDVDQRGLAGLFVDDVRVPNFFVECARSHTLDLTGSVPQICPGARNDARAINHCNKAAAPRQWHRNALEDGTPRWRCCRRGRAEARTGERRKSKAAEASFGEEKAGALRLRSGQASSRTPSGLRPRSNSSRAATHGGGR